MREGSRSLLIGSIGAVLSIAAVLLFVRSGAGNVLRHDLPLYLFLFPVVLAAWLGGLPPGLLATCLGLLAGAWLRTEQDGWRCADGVEAVAFLCIGTAVSGLSGALQGSRLRAFQQREKLRVTLASIGDAVVTTDQEGRVATLNPVAESLTGWSQREATGRLLEDVFRIVDEQTRQPVANPAYRVLTENKIVGLAHPTVLIARDGRERPIDDSGAPIRSPEGKVLGVVLVFRDISERRQSEEALAERNRLTALQADASSALSGAENLRAGLQTCAEALVRRLDLALACIWMLNETEGLLEVEASAGDDVRRNGPSGRVKVGEGPIGRIAGNRHPLPTNDAPRNTRLGDLEETDFGGHPLLVEGRVVGVLAVRARRALSAGVLTELSSLAAVLALYIDRKRGEQQIREREERLSLALTAAEMGTWRVDLRTNRAVRDANLNALLGLAAATTPTEEDRFARVHPEDRSRAIEAFDRAIRERRLYEVEVRILQPDGAVRWVREKGKPVGGDGNGPAYMTGVTVDVTQRRKLEDNLRQLAADLSEADRKKNEFLAMLAHELRNPLAPIRNSLQVMRLAEDDPVVARPCRELIERQVQQLVRLVDDLLDVSRFTQGKVDLRKEWIDLREVVRSAVETSRPLIEAAGHTLTVELAPGPLVLQADPTRLAQIISNLLNNAAKYTDRDGRISLTAGPEGDEVVVRVRDTGVGISADMLPRIFDLFTQVDGSSQRAQGGLGIGLTLVRRLVALHGGSVQAFSAGRGRGSEFVVRLRADPPEPTTPAKSAPAGADAKTASALRILIVDDNEDSADSLSTLMRLSGNEVRTATDGLAALATARDFSPNVVLLDIGLPGISGYEVAERLREQFDRSRLLLVAMTGYGQDDDRRRSREAGFDAHLVKPIDLDSLRAVLAHPEFHHSAEVTDGSRGTGWRGRSV